MSLDTFRNVIKFCLESQQVNPREYISVMLSLKEPMVSWKNIKTIIEEFGEEMYQNKIFMTMNTNGVLLTQDRIDFMRKHLLDIHISLDGPKDIHDRRRVYRDGSGRSSWEKIMQIIEDNPNADYMSFMTTIHKEDLSRVEEIFFFMSNLPISCWVYALDNNDDWDDETINELERQIKNFICSANARQLKKVRIADTAARFPNIDVVNGVKVLQDGTITLQPPVPNDGTKKGWFISKVIMGNVNDEVILPKEYQSISYRDYKIIGPHCKDDCIMHDYCFQGVREIYVEDFACQRVQHFARMAEFAKGGKMTDAEYQKIRDTYPIFNAVVNLTDGCNLRCPYCFTEHNTRQIDLGTMKTVVNFLIGEINRFEDFNGQPSIAFFGGEPMLRYDDIIKPFIEWCEETGVIDKYKMNFSMTTNGTLFTEERLKWLREHNVNILLSIDGDKTTQDDQRPGANGSSSFDKIYPMISRILYYYPGVTFRSAIEPRNVDKMVENYLFARRENFLHYFITPNISADWPLEKIEEACGQLALIAQIYYQDISKGTVPLVWDEFEQMIKDCFTGAETKEISYNHCGIGTNSIGVATNGDLNGCQEHNTYCEHDIFYIGNIFTGIDKERHKRLLSEFKGTGHPVCKQIPNLCKTCSFYNSCASHFCPSHNLGKGNRLIENELVVCVWKRFVRELALTILEQAAAENNQNFKNYLENLVTGKDRGFAAW